MSEENVEIVKRAIAAYGRRDYEAMRELGHPDLERWRFSVGRKLQLVRIATCC